MRIDSIIEKLSDLTDGETPTFTTMKIGSFTFRIAVQADVDDSEAQAVGNLIIEHSSTGTKREFSAT